MPTTIPTTTSSTRPGSPSAGDAYFETDTKNYIIYDGANWRGYESDGVSIPSISNSFSASFNGSSDYLNVGQPTTLAGATQQTVSFWFKGATAGELPDWGFRNTNGVNQFDGRKVTVSGFEGYYIDIRNGGSFNIKFPFADLPNDTNWHHYTLTFNAGVVAFYVDGSAKTGTTSGTAPTSINSTITDFSIGRMGQDNTYCAGNFDEFAMWDEALDSSNVVQLYNLGSPFDLSSDAGDYNKSADLTHWWRMGDHASDTDSGGGAPTNGDTIGNVENAANPNTNDASVGGGAPTYSSSTPS